MSTASVNLCRYELSPGRTCRQITLKNDDYCRHHRRLFRQTEAEAALQQSMERLAVKLSSLSTPDLLEALYIKLCQITTTIRSVPEAQIAVGITMERIRTELSVPMLPPWEHPQISSKFS